MGTNKIDVRQSVDRTALVAIGTPADTDLDTILLAINTLFANATPLPTPSVLMTRDSFANTQVNNLTKNLTSTISSGSTVTLTAGSAYFQEVTGTSTSVFVLPDATTLSQDGFSFQIMNRSTGSLTLETSGAATLLTMIGGTEAIVTCTSNATTVGTWDVIYTYSGPAPVAFGGTGITSGTSGGIPYFSSTSQMASSAVLPGFQVVLGGGVGGSPTTVSGTGTATQILTSNGPGVAPTWQTNPNIKIAPYLTLVTNTGSGTYTTSVGALYTRVVMVGGGGGGGGGGSSLGAGGTGGSGANANFGAATAFGGSPGSGTGAGSGGAGSPGGYSGIPAYGGSGGGFNAETFAGITTFATGGQGGLSFFGGNGVGNSNAAGGGAYSPGSGGAGGGSTITATAQSAYGGGGGGAGGYVEILVPAGSYNWSFTGGGGGVGGTGTSGGGSTSFNGGSGAGPIMYIFDYYQ